VIVGYRIKSKREIQTGIAAVISCDPEFYWVMQVKSYLLVSCLEPICLEIERTVTVVTSQLGNNSVSF